MKKFFTFIAVALMALTVKAQTEPLYTITTKITADAEWGADYAPYFAFQGTEVNVEVYADDYVIIKNWAGAAGCDLKVEYDSTVDVDADECMGNILAITSIINGVEQEPLNSYSKEIEGYTYNYVDIATGREDYPVCSTTLNEDGTLYWSFVELDKENKTGYVELSAYFMTADYDTENMAGSYYYCGWPEAEEPAEPEFYGTFSAEATELYTEDGELDTSYGVPFLTGLKDITVDVYDQYVVIHDWSKNPDSPRDLKVYCSHDENQSVTSLYYIKDGVEQAVPTDTKYIYTGYPKEEGNLYDVYYYDGYSYADWDETQGYVIIMGYPYVYNAEGKLNTGAWGYYYIYWGEVEEEVAGDVNGDGVVNITDLNLIIDAMSGESVTGVTDINGDGAVNITDLNLVIDIMSGE